MNISNGVVNKYYISTLLNRTTFLCLVTVFLCYGIAVSNGHVQPWLPFISDCAWRAPEMYFFRFGIITGAAHLYFLADYICDFLVVLHGENTNTISFARFISRLGAIGVAICAACDENENNTIHTTGAIIFFAGYLVFIWVCSIQFWDYGDSNQRLHKCHWRFRLVLCLVATVDMIAFIVFTVLNSNKTYQAFCEWIGFFLIIFYNYTFKWDITKTSTDGEGDYVLQTCIENAGGYATNWVP